MIKDPGTKLDLLLNNHRLTSESFDTLPWQSNPKTSSNSSSFTCKMGEKCAVLCWLCAHAFQGSMFEAGTCVARAEWILAGLFVLQVDALEHANLKCDHVLADCTVKLALEQQMALVSIMKNEVLLNGMQRVVG